ncbi:MAG: dihydropyrimidinase [Lachnospiraceae bacterium]|nr:dihydropyrimidinase [Lachnospiraceae bacterium]
MYDLVIRNGKLVTEKGVIDADLAVLGGKIANIVPRSQAPGTDAVSIGDSAEKIDAEGKYVLPGGVDVHTHLDMPLRDGLKSADDFVTGTIAAAIGGTTTVVDYACQEPQGSLKEALNVWKGKAKGACVDYGMHMTIARVDDETLSEMADMVSQGVTSFKIYLVYDMRLNDEEIYTVLERSAHLGTLVTVHCENYGVIRYRTKKLLAEGKADPKYHAISRPDRCEGEAVNRVLQIAAMADMAPVYIVHNTCREGVKYIEEARSMGQPVFAETCPQYLLLDDSKYELPGFEGAKYVMSPPLRSKADQEYLWQAIKNGTIKVIATDHCPFTFEEKKIGLHNFSAIPNGGTGIEERIALMYSEGRKQGLSYTDLSKLTATNPAKLFGMYPRKGTIRIGSDADLVLYDADRKTTITHDILHENVDYTCYEGVTVDGYPAMTILRGKVIAKDRAFVGEMGKGQFIRRDLP